MRVCVCVRTCTCVCFLNDLQTHLMPLMCGGDQGKAEEVSGSALPNLAHGGHCVSLSFISNVFLFSVCSNLKPSRQQHVRCFIVLLPPCSKRCPSSHLPQVTCICAAEQKYCKKMERFVIIVFMKCLSDVMGCSGKFANVLPC